MPRATTQRSTSLLLVLSLLIFIVTMLQLSITVEAPQMNLSFAGVTKREDTMSSVETFFVTKYASSLLRILDRWERQMTIIRWNDADFLPQGSFLYEHLTKLMSSRSSTNDFIKRMARKKSIGEGFKSKVYPAPRKAATFLPRLLPKTTGSWKDLDNGYRR
eukprot:scaffold5517_cov135-Cylindrotheca_fusiformis.AAC.23